MRMRIKPLLGSSESIVTREELKLMFEDSESRIQNQIQEEMLKFCDSINLDMRKNFQKLSSTCTNLVNSKYDSIHDRRSFQKSISNEEEDYIVSIDAVKTAIEIAFMDSNILKAMDQMYEMKNLRDVLNKSRLNRLIEPINDYEEVGTDNNRNHFCGIFMQSFRETIILSMTQVNIPIFIAENFVDDSEEMQAKLEAQIILWKKKFNNFIGQFWNHNSIQSLLNNRFPLETRVEDKEDGFEFIVQSLTDVLVEKIFLGINMIRQVLFICSFDNSQYTEDVLLFTPLEILKFVRKKIMDKYKTKRRRDSKLTISSSKTITDISDVTTNSLNNQEVALKPINDIPANLRDESDNEENDETNDEEFSRNETYVENESRNETTVEDVSQVIEMSETSDLIANLKRRMSHSKQTNRINKDEENENEEIQDDKCSDEELEATEDFPSSRNNHIISSVAPTKEPKKRGITGKEITSKSSRAAPKKLVAPPKTGKAGEAIPATFARTFGSVYTRWEEEANKGQTSKRKRK